MNVDENAAIPARKDTSGRGLKEVDESATSVAVRKIEKPKRLEPLKVSTTKLHAKIGTRREILRRRLKRAM
jgi:hypothetical protein